MTKSGAGISGMSSSSSLWSILRRLFGVSILLCSGNGDWLSTSSNIFLTRARAALDGGATGRPCPEMKPAVGIALVLKKGSGRGRPWPG
jgi:hypothetical protein